MIGWLAVAGAAEPHVPHGPGVRWHTIETRFFRVHWAEGDGHTARATARRAAELCDPLLLRLAADASFVPRGPYDLVVSDATDGMTAYSVPADGRVVLGADPADAVLRLRGRIDWVEDALAHELAHLVWDRRTSPFASSAGGGVEGVGVVELGGFAASLDLFAVHDVPYGLGEALAELGSEQAGVNAWDERREGLLLASALAGRLLSWDEWVVGADKGDVLDAERAYQQGYAFARWLREVHGEDVLRELADGAARRHRWSWAGVVREVTGVDARVLWARHRAHLLAEALAARAARVGHAAADAVELEAWPSPPGLSRADADAVAHPRDPEAARESTGSWELYPRRSPDGRFYAETKAGVVRVVKTDAPDAPDGPSAWLPAETGLPAVFLPDRDAVLIVTDATPGRPGWAPARPARTTAVWEVALDVDARGALVAGTRRGLRRVARAVPGTSRAREVALTPGGELIVVRHVDASDQLWTVALPGPGSGHAAAPVRRTSFPPHTWLQSPAVSPDGTRLAVSVFRENRGELWVADLPDWRWSRVPLPFGDLLDPSWTHDGRLLATAAVEGAWQVVRVDLRTGALAALTRTAAGASTPSEGPGGDLWFSETTAWGFKSSRLPARDVVPLPLAPAAPPLRPALPTAPAPPARPYRARPLPPAVSPLLRVEAGPATAGSAPGPRVAAGGWLDAHDALDTWTLAAFGLVGTVSGGGAELAWSGLGPTFRLRADGATTADGGTWVGSGEVAADLRWSDAATVSPAVTWIRAGGGPPLDSRRVRLGLGAAEWRSRHDPGPWASLDLTGARSAVDGEVTGWARAEGALGTRTALRWSVGPLDEHALVVELGARGVATTADVDPREEVGLGGDLWSAWRPLAVEQSLPFPALPPWAVTGEQLATGSARLVVPVLPRLRTAAGPLYLQGFELASGVDAAGVWPAGSGVVAWVAEARARARLQDRTWNSAVVVAKALDDHPPRVWLEVGGALP